MKIAFILSGLEPGRDGVGDYTRRLAAECIRQGHPCVILALNDMHVYEAVFESQKIEGISLSVLRLPRSLSWDDRIITARKWFEVFNPDWVSLQFVPFGFHPKGLPFDFPRHIKTIIGSRPLYLMFHELWVLWNFPLSLRKRLLGQFQKICLRWCLRKLKPQAFATQLPLYRTELNKIGVIAELVPLHGNIPVYPRVEAENWLADKCTSTTDRKQVKAGFFGNILSTLDPSIFAARVAELNSPGDELLLLTAGKIDGTSTKLWTSLEREQKLPAKFFTLGELSEREASLYFSTLDYGLTSYPPELMGKSGSVAAMREHGLPVIACGSMVKKTSGPAAANGQNHKPEPWTVQQTALSVLNQMQQTRL